MNTEHTPGPWTLEISDVPQTNKPFCGICGADGAGIVYATLRAPGELIANARLIAAAPDLLAALRSATFALESAVMLAGLHAIAEPAANARAALNRFYGEETDA
jgi:hypothetical protein